MQSSPPDIVSALRAARGILLDFDGVIADSEPVYHRSYCEALAPWGLSIEPEEYWLHFSSLGTGLEGFVDRHGIAGLDIEEVKMRQRRIYASLCSRGEIPLMPGAADLLEELHAGIWRHPWAIASNTDRMLIETILSHHSLRIPLVVGGSGLAPKPAPDILLAAARATGCPPERTLVFDDAWKGIAAARAGGFIPVLVRGGPDRLHVSEAVLEIDGIASLLQAIRDAAA